MTPSPVKPNSKFAERYINVQLHLRSIGTCLVDLLTMTESIVSEASSNSEVVLRRRVHGFEQSTEHIIIVQSSNLCGNSHISYFISLQCTLKNSTWQKLSAPPTMVPPLRCVRKSTDMLGCGFLGYGLMGWKKGHLRLEQSPCLSYMGRSRRKVARKKVGRSARGEPSWPGPANPMVDWLPPSDDICTQMLRNFCQQRLRL